MSHSKNRMPSEMYMLYYLGRSSLSLIIYEILQELLHTTIAGHVYGVSFVI